jgi:pimeloyl-ACP methyl ester carboxylesterase
MTSVPPSGRVLETLERVFSWLTAFALPLAAVVVLATASAHGQAPTPALTAPTVIVVGFVGGFVHSNDERHPEVLIAQQLSGEKIAGLHAATYENRHRGKALEQILHWLDTDGDGRLSVAEKQNARIVLFGHSWGGSAVIKLARDLSRQGIPVAMTIQVDSVNKIWGSDCIVPPNVGEALNFYQTRGLVHGCQTLLAADPSRTRILASNRLDYTSQPVGCKSCSWLNRHFLKSHEAMDCDQNVWSQIENQIQAKIKDVLQAPPVDHSGGLFGTAFATSP